MMISVFTKTQILGLAAVLALGFSAPAFAADLSANSNVQGSATVQGADVNAAMAEEMTWSDGYDYNDLDPSMTEPAAGQSINTAGQMSAQTTTTMTPMRPTTLARNNFRVGPNSMQGGSRGMVTFNE